ncbi:hypothetical protein HK100_009481, partial [Physocladia obscura]
MKSELKLLDPLSFQEVKDVVASGDWLNFTRTPEVSLQYDEFMAHLPTVYASVTDCVKINTLNFQSRKDETSGLLHAIDPIEREFVKLVRNPFPYSTLPGVEHWVLWNLGETDLTSQQCDKILEKEFGPMEYF